MYLVFTCMPGESYHRWLWSLVLYLRYVFQALINSLICWSNLISCHHLLLYWVVPCMDQIAYYRLSSSVSLYAQLLSCIISWSFVLLSSYFCSVYRYLLSSASGLICTTCSFPFIFAPVFGATPATPDFALFIYYAAFVVIFQIGWASVQISHLSLIPELTSDESEVAGLNGWRSELLCFCYLFHLQGEGRWSKSVVVVMVSWLLDRFMGFVCFCVMYVCACTISISISIYIDLYILYVCVYGGVHMY